MSETLDSSSQTPPLMKVESLRLVAENGYETPSLTAQWWPSSLVVLSGTIGSGKSLLCSAIAGVARPGLEVRGRIVVPEDQSGRRRRRFDVGYVPEDPRLAALPTDHLDGMIREVLGKRGQRGAPDAGLRYARELLAEFGLSAERLGRVPFRALSMGERKLVLLTLALVSRAAFVVIDGLFEGLSLSARNRAWSVIERARAEGTAFLIAVRSRSTLADVEADAHFPLSDREAPGALPLLPRSQKQPEFSRPEANLFEVERLRLGAERAGFFKRATKFKILQGLSLSLRGGESLAVFGSHGSGKSALVDVVVGYRRADSGTVRFRGRELRSDEARTHKGIQLVLGENSDILEPRRLVVDALGGEENGKRALVRTGLPERILDQYLEDLSAGEAQLISLMTRLQQKPTLVFLDEPHFSEDSPIASRMAETLLAERQLGCSFVIATSSLAVARALSDRIAHVHRGKTLEIGPADALLERPLHPMTEAVARGAPLPILQEREHGCFYFDACSRRRSGDCDTREPALAYGTSGEIQERHLVACFYPLVPGPSNSLDESQTPAAPGVHETWLPGDEPAG